MPPSRSEVELGLERDSPDSQSAASFLPRLWFLGLDGESRAGVGGGKARRLRGGWQDPEVLVPPRALGTGDSCSLLCTASQAPCALALLPLRFSEKLLPRVMQ